MYMYMYIVTCSQYNVQCTCTCIIIHIEIQSLTFLFDLGNTSCTGDTLILSCGCVGVLVRGACDLVLV